jgi:glycyl-tRNA synthetase beta chain
LRARLEDARFYLKQDLAVPLAGRVESLKQVTFHEKLGTLYDKTTRLVELAREQAVCFGVEPKEAERAARLAKADLVTGLVREFPELQGAIGGDYAARQGESQAVAEAIGQHYRPRSTGDALPSSPLGQWLSLVDKIDTVVGYFGVGLAPTGSEDPYALRRQAAGVVQLVALHPTLDLVDLLKQANQQFDRAFKGNWPASVMQAVMKFLGQRLEWQLLSEGCKQEVVAAVLGVPWKNPAKVKRWVAALQAVLPTPAGDDLLTVYRRVGRIVPKNFLQEVDPARLTDSEERQLAEAYETVRKAVSTTLASEDEMATLKARARLRPAVDRFFDKVMVMADDAALRNNRLALVNGVKKLFEQIADFSKISTAPAAGAREVS